MYMRYISNANSNKHFPFHNNEWKAYVCGR